MLTQHDPTWAAPPIVGPKAADLRALGGLMAAGAVALPRLPAVGPLCPLRRVTGIPCPFCGMTTGVIALSHGDVGASLAANPLAIVVVLAVLVACLPAAVRAALGRRVTFSQTARRRLPWLLGPLWLFELHRYDQI